MLTGCSIQLLCWLDVAYSYCVLTGCSIVIVCWLDVAYSYCVLTGCSIQLLWLGEAYRNNHCTTENCWFCVEVNFMFKIIYGGFLRSFRRALRTCATRSWWIRATACGAVKSAAVSSPTTSGAWFSRWAHDSPGERVILQVSTWFSRWVHGPHFGPYFLAPFLQTFPWLVTALKGYFFSPYKGQPESPL